MNHIAFKKFLTTSGLSTRRFGDFARIGKSTIHRLAQPEHGGLTPAYVRRIKPVLMEACRLHLEQAGAGAGEVHRQLADIFEDDFQPMINHRCLLTPEILEFFGLARDPFAAPRSALGLFTTPEIESVYEQLRAAVRCQGFIAVLAPVGAGKTVLKNRLIAGFGPRSKVQGPRSGSKTTDHGPRTTGQETVHGPGSESETLDFGLRTLDQTSLIISPKFADMSRVTAAGIVAYVLEELGVRPRRSLVLAQKQLQQRLAALAEQNVTVALCFDECHRLNDTLLTALKNFYELGTGGFERYLGLILFGQPQFADRLRLPRFREIAERLACVSLPAFSIETSHQYLAHCLQTALHETRQSPGSKVQCPKSEAGSDLGPWTLDLGPSSNPKSEIPNPQSQIPTPKLSGGVVLSSNPKSEIPNPKLFTSEALSLIMARASTPLGIANVASAALIEAYRKGERIVLPRFVPGETGPKTMKVGKLNH